MNWIYSILFFVCIIPFCYFLGDLALSIFHYKVNNERRFIAGYFLLFFISFCIAFPAQLFHIQWNIYFYIQLLTFIVIFILLFYLYSGKIRRKIRQLKEVNIKYILISHLKKYWLLYLFVILFSSFSIANQSPYYQMNYDDFYYIGKVVNQVGSPILSSEDYYNGMINLNGIDLARIINTFEISYGYWAYLFHIGIPFFCRVTMVISNYALIALVLKEMASFFVEERYSQYAILPIFVLLISHGYLMDGLSFLHIRSYDMWQFQTAIFYGGSVVRVLSLPVLMLFSYELIEKFELRKILWIALLSISFVSFSTIFIQIFILYVFFILLIKDIYVLYLSIKKRQKRDILLYTILLIAILLIFLFSKKLDNFSVLNTEKYEKCINNFYLYYNHYVNFDILLKIGWAVLLLVFISTKNGINKMVALFFIFLYIFFKRPYFIELITLSSFNIFFVSMRTIASLQYIILLMIGILFVHLYNRIYSQSIIIDFISVFCIIFIIAFITNHYDKIRNYDYIGSGMIKKGYDFSRVIDFNTTMMPEIYNEIGAYFNHLEYANYKLLAPSTFQYDDTFMYAKGFVITSNRIETCSYEGCNGLTSEEYAIIDEFFQNKKEYDEIKSILINREIDYILVFDSNQKDVLINDGNVLVLESSEIDERYYLIKMMLNEEKKNDFSCNEYLYGKC